MASAATAVLVALIAVQTARLGWTAFAPIGPIGAASPAAPSGRDAADFALLEAFDPFFRGQAAAAAAAPASDAAGLKLFGVRAGRGASAIIAGPDGRQAAYRLGEEVTPGVVLRGVAADHVVLASGGRRTSLFFPPPSAAAAAVIPAAYAPAPSPPPPMPAGLAGMQPGDVLRSVNGKAVTGAEQAETLARELASGGEAVIEFERAGQVRTTTLKTSSP